MDKYKTMESFGGVGFLALMESVVTAVPVFFPVIFFLIFVFGSGASYFAILKTTGKKRFWHSTTAFGFICFLGSLLISAQNTVTTEYLSGYWVGFYVLITLGSWFMLSNYK